MFLVNRSGNRPSHEGAAACFDKAIVLCREAGFKQILLRGDTDFSQTAHLDRWDAQTDVKFLFGIDAMAHLVARAEALPEAAWKKLERPAKYEVQTDPRSRPENVKEQIVKAREFKNIRLRQRGRGGVRLSAHGLPEGLPRGGGAEEPLGGEGRGGALRRRAVLLLYHQHLRAYPPAQIVLLANDRCDQENLIEQLKSGVQALKMPVDNLVSNWAYMVMAALAWSLKAWLALSLPEYARAAGGKRHAQQKQQLLRHGVQRRSWQRHDPPALPDHSRPAAGSSIASCPGIPGRTCSCGWSKRCVAPCSADDLA